MSAEEIDDLILSEAEIEDIVADIKKAQQTAKQHGNGRLGLRAVHLVGALSVILGRIDKRIGDAVWME